MKITEIKKDKWYETNLGIGQCIKSGGTFPVSVRIRIDFPYERGELNFNPRYVLREIPNPEIRKEK